MANPYKVAHRALRGRYWIAIALGVVLALGGAFVGWKLGKRLFRSDGLVRFEYQVPTVMGTGDQYIPPEIYAAFLQSQVAVLSSREMVDLALEQPVWQRTGLGNSPTVIQNFADNLKVEHKPTTDYLTVTYVDRDPRVAAAAVNALVDAYELNYSKQTERFDRQRLQALEDRRDVLRDEIADLQRKSNQLSADMGFANVDKLYDQAVTQVADLKKRLTDISLARILKKNQALGSIDLSAQQIAIADPVMRGYMADRERAEEAIEQLRARGYGDSHRLMIEAKKSLELASDRINRYSQNFRGPMPSGAAAAPATDGPMAYANHSVQALEQNERDVAVMLAEARKQMEELGGKKLAAADLKLSQDRLEQSLDAINQRINMLQVEAGVRGRLTVVSRGPTPIAPYQDQRLYSAAIGAMAGGMTPAVLLLGLGLLSTRYRYSDETEDELARNVPLLGVLPRLPGHMRDPERAADAAQCVHQIRVMLQANRTSGRPPVYLVSSASPSEGKTSLAAALGLSFAASGSRTLLIDGDLVGQKLSHGFGISPTSGIFAALRDRNFNAHIRPLPAPGLFLLPSGREDIAHANVLSTRSVGRLIDEARRSFDVVLIDSGPILGSVEASVIAPAVDGVILVIARKQQRPLVDRAIRQLRSIGATLAGMVFNRAEPTDFYRSTSYASARSVNAHGMSPWAMARRTDEMAGLGPVVHSVASLLPRSSDSEGDNTSSDPSES